MAKFTQSLEAMTSNLHLWDVEHTQTAIKECKVIEYHPLASIHSSDTITFRIPEQENLWLDYVELYTDLKFKPDLNHGDQVSVVSNLANSLFKNVSVSVNGIDFMQSFDNAYNISTWFNTALNTDPNREKELLWNEGFLMDDARTKEHSESLVVFHRDAVAAVPAVAAVQADPANGVEAVAAVPGVAAIPEQHMYNPSLARRQKIVFHEWVFISKLQCTLFQENKLLPDNLAIDIKLVKSTRGFPMLCSNDKENYIDITGMKLRAHYKVLTEPAYKSVQARLSREAALYRVDEPKVTFHNVPVGVRTVTFNNLITGVLPKLFVCAINHRSAYANNKERNPYTFLYMSKIQAWINGRPHFDTPVENQTTRYLAFQDELGIQSSGANLIAPELFDAHMCIPFNLNADKNLRHHLNLMKHGNIRLEIQLLRDSIEDLVLVVYALYDKVFEINKDRQVRFL